MNNLQDATERICELKGSVVTLDVLACAILRALPAESKQDLLPLFAQHAEAARTALLNIPVGESVISSFENEVARMGTLVAGISAPATTAPSAGASPSLSSNAVDPAVLAATRVHTFAGNQGLTGASGFFFERDERLFLVTSRHVLADEKSGHFPDRIEIEIHIHPTDLTQMTRLSMLLYAEGLSQWRQGEDSGGEVDVAVIEIDRRELPATCTLRAFTPDQLGAGDEAVDIGSALAIVGFPLGFHDTVHHLPVVRQASVASPFGVRFQGKGHFLTDARMHRGSSGAPVLHRMRDAGGHGQAMHWKLLGIHSSRMDMSRDLEQDESLGLNSAWYADILMTLTDLRPPAEGNAQASRTSATGVAP